jgi:hypothetical protein
MSRMTDASKKSSAVIGVEQKKRLFASWKLRGKTDIGGTFERRDTRIKE